MRVVAQRSRGPAAARPLLMPTDRSVKSLHSHWLRICCRGMRASSAGLASETQATYLAQMHILRVALRGALLVSQCLREPGLLIPELTQQVLKGPVCFI